MKREHLSPDQALERGMKLPFVLIRSINKVYLGNVPSQPPELDTLLEARFFDKDQEIRLFRKEDTLCAASLTREPKDRVLEEQYALEKRFGTSLTYCRHLGIDEDGQTIFVATRLCYWEGV